VWFCWSYLCSFSLAAGELVFEILVRSVWGAGQDSQDELPCLVDFGERRTRLDAGGWRRVWKWRVRAALTRGNAFAEGPHTLLAESVMFARVNATPLDSAQKNSEILVEFRRIGRFLAEFGRRERKTIPKRLSEPANEALCPGLVLDRR
jgi:hypothetical protein